MGRLPCRSTFDFPLGNFFHPEGCRRQGTGGGSRFKDIIDLIRSDIPAVETIVWTGMRVVRFGRRAGISLMKVSFAGASELLTEAAVTADDLARSITPAARPAVPKG